MHLAALFGTIAMSQPPAPNCTRRLDTSRCLVPDSAQTTYDSDQCYAFWASAAFLGLEEVCTCLPLTRLLRFLRMRKSRWF